MIASYCMKNYKKFIPKVKLLGYLLAIANLSTKTFLVLTWLMGVGETRVSLKVKESVKFYIPKLFVKFINFAFELIITTEEQL